MTIDYSFDHIDNIDHVVKEFAIKEDEFNNVKKDAATKFKEELSLILANVFQQVPQIKAVSWSQCTPYFCDGDTCHFSMDELYFLGYIPQDKLANYEAEQSEFEYGESPDTPIYNSYGIQENDNFTYDQKIIINEANRIFRHSEFFKYAFGDHVIVFATENGIQTIDYTEHD